MTEIIRSVWPVWEVEREIGGGTTSSVYAVRRTEQGVTLRAAVKVISLPDSPEWRTLLDDEGSPDRAKDTLRSILSGFTNEIQTLQAFRGLSNIVSIDDFAVVDQPDGVGWTLLIRMELLTPLNQWLGTKQDRKASEAEIIRLGRELCTALDLCASRNIIHRDIKPENIFVNDYGYFKLGDFGVARRLEGLESTLSQKGTPLYAAPEVIAGTEYDFRADIYSLGIVLYKLANHNTLPFLKSDRFNTAEDRQKALNRRLSGEELPAPSDASPELAKVILKACSYKPEDRYPSARAMREALELAESGRKKKSPSKVLTACACAVLLVGAGVLTGVFLGRNSFPSLASDETPSPSEPEEAAFSVWDGSVASGFDAGEGTEASPYEISSPAQLALLSRLVEEAAADLDGTAYAKKHYLLTNDLYFDPQIDFPPIGPSDEVPFRGSLDGDGHSIFDLSCRGGGALCGLFGCVEGASLSRLSMARASVSCTDPETKGCGGFAGRLSDSSLSDCHFDGTVSGSSPCGGLAGRAIGKSAKIEGCSVTGQITSAECAGGIAGYASLVTVLSCENRAAVIAEADRAGGLIGFSEACSIEEARNLGTVTGRAQIGGITGFDSGSAITSAENAGAVTALDHQAGGIAGCCESGTVFVSSSNRKRVHAENSYAGGILGYGKDNISVTDCKNLDSVSSNGEEAGGIAGRIKDACTVKDCQNEGSVSSHGEMTGGIAGFVSDSAILRCSNTGEVLSDHPVLGGIAGQVSDSTVQSCLNTADLSLGDPAGNEDPAERLGGICGQADFSKILSCENRGSVGGSANHSGGIAGFAEFGCSIDDCENSGSVAGWDNAGGIVGVLRAKNGDDLFPCSVRGCSNSGAVSGKGAHCGGIAGLCYEGMEIADCKNTGDVSSSCAAGGVVGLSDGPCTIAGCVSVADIRVDAWGCGGIIGNQDGGTIHTCYSGGTVLGYELLRGVAGRFYHGAEMDECFTEVTITHNNGDASHTYYGLFTPYGDSGEAAETNYCLITGERTLADHIGTMVTEDEMDALLPAVFRDAHALAAERNKN